MSEENNKLYIYVYTGFVKEPMFDSEKIRGLIEEKDLLKGNEYFKNYCTIPIENETVREYGLCEYVVIPETYIDYDFAEVEEIQPYYMITDGEEIYLFEKVWNTIYPCTANVYKEDDITKLTITYNIIKNDCENDIVVIKDYELKNKKFEKIQEYKFWEPVKSDNGIAYIGMLEDGKPVLYVIQSVENFNIQYGRKTKYVIKEEKDIANGFLITE